MQRIFIQQKIVLVIFGLLLFVVLLEIGLRIGGFVFLSLQEYRNRISLKEQRAYRIMCLGGSTTAIGGKDSYPTQLQEILNQQDIGIKFSVINKGVDGIDSADIVSRLENNLDKYTPDMVITMMGINDGEGTIVYEDSLAFKTKSFFKAFRTYKLVKLLKLHIKNKTQERYKEVKEINSDFVLGWLYSEQERIDVFKLREELLEVAEEILKKAIEVNPRNTVAYLELGCCYKRQRKYDQAEEMFQKAIETNPKKDSVYLESGCLYNEQGKYNQAKEMLKRTIEINPENIQAYSELGHCYRCQGEYKQAEEMFKKAIGINPRSAELHNGLAICYKEQGKNKLAEEYFRKANKLRLETYNPVTRYNYQKLKEVVIQRGIKLICVQYPVRSVEPLKKMLEPHEGIIFVDNEMVFKKALKYGRYDEYFTDNFGGDFGHCTRKGNRLLAENIADVILKECFK